MDNNVDEDEILQLVLDNGIKVIYKPDDNFNLRIVFTNFGFKTSFSYKKVGLIHFIEHLLVGTINKLLKILISASTSFEHMSLFFSKHIEIDNKFIDKLINFLFKNNKIYLNEKYINNNDIKLARYHIKNELDYRHILELWIGSPLYYLLSKYNYIGGTGFDIDYDINFFNKVLSTISTSEIIFITNNKDILKYLMLKLKKIKKTPRIKKKILYKLPKQKIKESIIVLSISSYYTVTIFIPLTRVTSIGTFILSTFIIFNMDTDIFNNTIAITITCGDINILFASLINLKNNKYSNKIQKINYNLYFDNFIKWNNYLNTFKIIKILKSTNTFDFYKNEVDSTINEIVNNYNKYDSFFLNIPLYNLFNTYNTVDKLNYPVYESEMILKIPQNFILDNMSTIIQKAPNYIQMEDFSSDLNVCFFLFANANYIIESDKIILYNLKNIHIENNNYVLYNEYYFDKLPLIIYYKYIYIYLLTNAFTSLYDVVKYINLNSKIYFNPNFIGVNSFDSKIKLENKIINIKTEYNFIIILMNDINDFYNTINNLSMLLVSKHLIYLIRTIETDKFLFCSLLTNNTNKAYKLCKKYLYKIKIQKYIMVISTKSNIIDITELINSKIITYK